MATDLYRDSDPDRIRAEGRVSQGAFFIFFCIDLHRVALLGFDACNSVFFYLQVGWVLSCLI